MRILSDPVSRPEDFPAALARAWASREGARIAGLFTDDADFVNVAGVWRQGRDAIAGLHDRLLRTAAYGQTTLMTEGRRTRYLTASAAQVMCHFSLSGRLHRDGSTREVQLWTATALLQRQPGDGWLAVGIQFTAITAGSEALIAAGKPPRPDHITPRDL